MPRPKKQTKSFKRLNLALQEITSEQLERIQRRTGTATRGIEKALALYDFVLEQQSHGAELFMRKPGEPIDSLIVLL